MSISADTFLKLKMEYEMKILHISTNDLRGGGAGKAALRLHRAMLDYGIDSKMLVLNKRTSNDNSVETVVNSPRLARFLAITHVLDERVRCYKYQPYAAFSLASSGFDLVNKSSILEADIIYIHWINRGMLSLSGIEKILSLGKPTYWVLHDMWPFTGGCHYSFECEKYMQSCGNCPLLHKHSSPNDISHKEQLLKQRHWSLYKNLHIITPSTWLAECAKKSYLFSKLSVTVIPNTIDTELYSPKEKSLSRKKFGLEEDFKVIMFGAHSATSNPYKGWIYMQQALESIKDRNVVAAVLGAELDINTIRSFHIPVKCVGILTDEQDLAALYSTADVYVSPSLADNFPNTIVESMSCGTPVVGFNVGGIPDLIKHKHNGYLATYKSPEDLARGIEWVLSKEKESFQTRKFIGEISSKRNVIARHRKLWESAL